MEFTVIPSVEKLADKITNEDELSEDTIILHSSKQTLASIDPH